MDSLNGESNNSGDSDIDKGSPLSLAAGDRGIDDKDIGDNELVPRDYQLELFQAAREENTIIYLQTGSGKTYISVLLILDMAAETRKALCEKGRRIVFLVPTIVLAQQQAQYLRKYTKLNVSELHGSSKNIKSDQPKLMKELDSNNVLVLTYQTFLIILNHSFLDIEQVNLLVVDECHSVVKDSPMKNIMEFIYRSSLAGKTIPRVLGLTAALFRKQCKPLAVYSMIKDLETAMNARVRTASDIHSALQNSTKPTEVIIECSKESSGADYVGNSRMIGQIKSSIFATVRELTKSMATSTVADKALENSVSILKEISYLTEAFGSFGANYGVTLYAQDIENLRSMTIHSEHKNHLSLVVETVDQIKGICGSEFERCPMDQIQFLTTPRVLRLLDVLRKFRPLVDDPADSSSSQVEGALCGIIFVARRTSANLLCHLLSLASCHDASLSFIRPLFTFGQTMANSNKQKAVFEKFCNRTCNLLVATRVLEEGVDVRACNLVIRFDPVKTFCDFVQSKGRARSPNALYCLMVEESDGAHSTTDSSIDSVAQFHAIEQILLNGTRTKAQGAEDQKKYWDNHVSTYRPNPDGPCITLSTATTVINRYCASLPSGQKTVLSPHLTTEQIDNISDVDEQYLRHLKIAGMRKNTRYYQGKLTLPLNSPLRSEIVGQVMPTKQLAKKMVLLDTCIRLHKMNELDDQHLLPASKESKKSSSGSALPPKTLLSSASAKKSSSGAKKTSCGAGVGASAGASAGTGASAGADVVYESFYRKATPAALVNCMPDPDRLNYLYVLDYDLVQELVQSTSSLRLDQLQWKLGIVTSKPLPSINAFPIFTIVGMVDVRFRLLSSTVRVNHKFIELCQKFQRHIFHSIIGVKVDKDDLIKELAAAYLVVPVRLDSGAIDVHMMENIINFPLEDEVDYKHRQLMSRRSHYRSRSTPYGQQYPFGALNGNPFHDKVVVSCHNNVHRCRVTGRIKTQMHPFYVEALSHLTPLSYFPERAYTDYKDHYQKRYGVDVVYDHQPLLQVSKATSKSLTFLTPKYLNRKVKTDEPTPKRPNKWGMTSHLVPELCIIHPYPASLWKQTAWMPSILYRLNTLLLAEEFRVTICNEAGVGNLRNSDGKEWEPLRNIVPNSFQTVEEPKAADSMLSALKPFFSIDESNLPCEERNRRMKADAKRCGGDDSGGLKRGVKRKREMGSDCSQIKPGPGPASQQRYGIERIRFDDNDIFPIDDAGPSPARILQSLTTQFTNCGFNLERQETIGDSFLKLVTSVYAYCVCSSHEGKLSEIRMCEICNKNLCKLGQKLGLPHIMSAEKFLAKENWLPPSHVVPTKVADVVTMKQKEILGDDRKLKVPNPRIWHNITNKSIADAIESLIGTYLTCNGIRGALKLMKWMGIQVPDPGEGSSCFGMDVPSPLLTEVSNADDILDDLLTNFHVFESSIGYTFRNRYFLLQAFSHASFHPNRLTNCYQRLEFLGDAVLDYLVTRYLYEDVELYSPGKMTDLRSALVNNYLFSVIAVRNKFHNYLKHLNSNLQASIDKFAQRQEECGHMVLDEGMLAPDGGEPEIPEDVESREHEIPEDIETPKVLGDIFESVAGAIFLDSGMSLDAVWKVFYPLMKDEIAAFCKQLPISPIRKLHETVPGLVKLLKYGALEDGQYCAAFEVDDIGVFKGVGRNIRLAKCNAARYALKELDKAELVNRKLLTEMRRQSFAVGHLNSDQHMTLEQVRRFTSLADRVQKQIPSPYIL